MAVLDWSHGCVQWRSLAVSYRLQWHLVLFVETRVSSSGKTWLAKLVEIVIISAGRGEGSCCFWKL